MFPGWLRFSCAAEGGKGFTISIRTGLRPLNSKLSVSPANNTPVRRLSPLPIFCYTAPAMWANSIHFTGGGPAMGLYSHYDGAHNHPVNRALHMVAIPLGFSSLIVVWFHPVIAVLQIPSAFALAWLGHLIEGNRPAFLS